MQHTSCIVEPGNTLWSRSKLRRRRADEDDEDVKLLMTILGVGYYTALLVRSEIEDINRFSDGKKLCSYVGLVPSIHASGRMVSH